MALHRRGGVFEPHVLHFFFQLESEPVLYSLFEFGNELDKLRGGSLPLVINQVRVIISNDDYSAHATVRITEQAGSRTLKV